MRTENIASNMHHAPALNTEHLSCNQSRVNGKRSIQAVKRAQWSNYWQCRVFGFSNVRTSSVEIEKANAKSRYNRKTVSKLLANRKIDSKAEILEVFGSSTRRPVNRKLSIRTGSGRKHRAHFRATSLGTRFLSWPVLPSHFLPWIDGNPFLLL